MNPDDLIARWNNHVNDCLADDGWAFGEDLVYAPAGPGQEPVPVLNTNDAVFYTVWLHVHGIITDEEYRWLKADIERARQEADAAEEGG